MKAVVASSIPVAIGLSIAAGVGPIPYVALLAALWWIAPS